jgi:hypothetical protein
VSDIIFTRIEKNSSNLDAVQFNRHAARAAADSALVFAISSSWEADMSREMEKWLSNCRATTVHSAALSSIVHAQALQ